MAKGKKYDSGKNRLDLIPFDALDEVGHVLTYGAGKYGDRNWELGVDEARLMAAALRHISAHMQGNPLDDESGERHLAHAATNLLMAIALDKRKK